MIDLSHRTAWPCQLKEKMMGKRVKEKTKKAVLLFFSAVIQKNISLSYLVLFS